MGQKGFIQVLLLVLLIIGIPVGVYLVQQRTNLLPKAVNLSPLNPPYLSLVPRSADIGPSCQVSLQVEIDTADSLTDGAEAVIFFDKNKLKVLNIENGNFYPMYPGNLLDNQNGIINITGLSSIGSPVKGKGILAKINFQVLEGAAIGSTDIKFDFDPNNKFKTSDSNIVENGTVSEVLNSVGDGIYNIISTSCNITPSSPSPTTISSPSSTPQITPSPQVTPSPLVDSDKDGFSDDLEKLIGTDFKDACPDNSRDPAWPPDLNNSKKVTSADNTEIARVIRRYDLNGDLKVDSLDQKILTSYLNKSCR